MENYNEATAGSQSAWLEADPLAGSVSDVESQIHALTGVSSVVASFARPAAHGQVANDTEPCDLFDSGCDYLLDKYHNVLKVIIVRAPDGGQLRGQITGTKSIRTVIYPSAKMKEGRYGEGATEIERIKAEEVNTHIVKGIAQPCRIHALLEGHDEWLVHIPDFSNLVDTGERVLIDAKRNWSDFRKPQGLQQTFLGELAAEALNYRYERIVLSSMGGQVRRDNVDEIQASRFVYVPDQLVARAASAVAKGPISLGNLADLLHPINGRSMVYALMVRRVVEIDLDTRLTRRSECIGVKPLPLGMPSLRR